MSFSLSPWNWWLNALWLVIWHHTKADVGRHAAERCCYSLVVARTHPIGFPIHTNCCCIRCLRLFVSRALSHVRLCVFPLFPYCIWEYFHSSECVFFHRFTHNTHNICWSYMFVMRLHKPYNWEAKRFVLFPTWVVHSYAVSVFTCASCIFVARSLFFHVCVCVHVECEYIRTYECWKHVRCLFPKHKKVSRESYAIRIGRVFHISVFLPSLYFFVFSSFVECFACHWEKKKKCFVEINKRVLYASVWSGICSKATRTSSVILVDTQHRNSQIGFVWLLCRLMIVI